MKNKYINIKRTDIDYVDIILTIPKDHNVEEVLATIDKEISMDFLENIINKEVYIKGYCPVEVAFFLGCVLKRVCSGINYIQQNDYSVFCV